MASLTKVTALCLLGCSLLFVGCSDDTEGPAADAFLTDGAIQDAPMKPDGPRPPDAGSLSCGEMEQVYLNTLELARACQPRSSINHCTTLVTDRITCGCNTAVNEQNTEAIAKLRSLQVSYENKKCASGPCPSRPCAQVEVGDCNATPPNSKVPGLCEDN